MTHTSGIPDVLISANGKTMSAVTYTLVNDVETDNLLIELKTPENGRNSVGLSEIVIIAQ